MERNCGGGISGQKKELQDERSYKTGLKMTKLQDRERHHKGTENRAEQIEGHKFVNAVSIYLLLTKYLLDRYNPCSTFYICMKGRIINFFA